MQDKQRIIVVGASGVGKTTLVAALAPLLGLTVIPELARVVCNEWGFERIGDIPQERQEDFKFAVLKRQITEEEQLTSFISDRSTLDAWVLWQRWNICQAMTYDSERLYESARSQAEKYTHILYLPPSFAPQEDGFRWTDLDYQKQIDRLTRMTLFEWDLLPRTLSIKSVDHDERVKEALDWIKTKAAGC